MIAALFVRALLALGASRSAAQKFGPYAACVAFIALVGVLAGLWLHFHDRGVVADHEAKIEAKAAPARDAAASERAADTIANSKQEDRYHDAIAKSGPDRPAAPSTVALGCERLRRAGRAPLPAECGPGGGDRSQADPRR